LDHFSLNKFDSATNPNYVQVRAVVVELYQAALRRQAAPAPKGSSQRNESSSREEKLRKEAIRELHEEEARKTAAIRDLEYRARLAEEKRAAEAKFCERLKKSMRKYGVEDADAILEAHPLPQDNELRSAQEIQDKEKWHRSILKGMLSNQGLDGGQIDEILNDTGETMVVDGVETAYTKMAAKWVSTRTLDAYDIPWQYEQVGHSYISVAAFINTDMLTLRPERPLHHHHHSVGPRI
jgi:hypothetical protein